MPKGYPAQPARGFSLPTVVVTYGAGPDSSSLRHMRKGRETKEHELTTDLGQLLLQPLRYRVVQRPCLIQIIHLLRASVFLQPRMRLAPAVLNRRKGTHIT